MEYCCHVWAGTPSWYLKLFDKLHKWICWTVGPSLAASWTLGSLMKWCWYYFGRCLSELAQLVPLPYSWGRSTRCSDRLHDFFVTIPRCCKDVYVNSFFHHTARLSGIICLLNAFVWPLIFVALSLELTDIN